MSSHRFAWDGLSFEIPAGWDLAIRQSGRKVTRVEFEDDYSVRLEAEWMRPRRGLDADKFRRRYDRASRRLTRDAEDAREIQDLPEAWVAFLYTLADERKLLTAFFLSRKPSLFCSFIFYFDAEDEEVPDDVMETLWNSFEINDGPVVPWMLYDVSLEVPREFRLADVRVESGRKHFTFKWRLRIFHVWFFSLADVLLKDRSIEEWGAGFLNDSWEVRGPVFTPGADGRIEAGRRTLIHRFGRYDEIIRMCFRYHARCVRDTNRNQAILSVFNYREMKDLEMLTRVAFNPNAR